TLPDEGLAVDDFSKLYDLLEESQKIILLSDNCGEIVVDNLIAEYLVSYRKKEVYLGLKGGPVANDCSLDDFKRDGLAENATETFVVSSTFGWNLNQTTLRFKELLETADVLIVKGQSNYETTLNNLVRHSDVKYPPTFCVLRTKWVRILSSKCIQCLMHQRLLKLLIVSEVLNWKFHKQKINDLGYSQK
ncbi:MAG: ARMT1-like domain-containing protein, partial [Candidatus Heimdallarchaeota archaeon]